MTKTFKNFKKRIAIFSIICMVFSFMPTVAFGAGASDISGHWAYDKIQTYLDAGLTTGYEDGTFKPDVYITRAEFITLVNTVFGYTGVAVVNYTDIFQGQWYTKAVAIAEAAGYITGYPDNTFRPEAPITRAEAATVLMRINELIANTQGASNFNDVDTLEWFAAAIGAVFGADIMNGYPDGSFKPGDFIKRGEALVAVDNGHRFFATLTPTQPAITTAAVIIGGGGGGAALSPTLTLDFVTGTGVTTSGSGYSVPFANFKDVTVKVTAANYVSESNVTIRVAKTGAATEYATVTASAVTLNGSHTSQVDELALMLYLMSVISGTGDHDYLTKLNNTAKFDYGDSFTVTITAGSKSVEFVISINADLTE